MAMSPSRICSRDGKICRDGDALSTIFSLACFCALLLTVRFSFFFSFFSIFLHHGMFIFFVSLRLCSSHLLLSASTYFIARVLSACVIYTLPHLRILLFLYSRTFFCSSYVSGGIFFWLSSRTRYASTSFAYLDSLAFGFLSHCLTTEFFISL